MSASHFDRFNQLLDEIKAEVNNFPEPLKEELGRYFQKFVTSIERYNDLSSKQAVYKAVARFLQKHFSEPPQVCLAAAYRLCGETDPQFLNKLPPQTHAAANAAARLTASAKSLILGVKALYFRGASGEYVRKTEVWFADKGKPAAFTLEEHVAWDHLPADVRESFLLDGARLQVFKVYPKE
jgi:hypothetical protein